MPSDRLLFLGGAGDSPTRAIVFDLNTLNIPLALCCLGNFHSSAQAADPVVEQGRKIVA